MSAIKHTILYVEDDLDDLFMVQQAFEKYDQSIAVIHANNGVAALNYLDGLKKGDLFPCLIILDMNMPGMDGRETLVRLKQSPNLQHLPVVIFTTSSNQPDKDFALKWGADFNTKPIVYADLQELATTFVTKCNFEISKRA